MLNETPTEDRTATVEETLPRSASAIATAQQNFGALTTPNERRAALIRAELATQLPGFDVLSMNEQRRILSAVSIGDYKPEADGPIIMQILEQYPTECRSALGKSEATERQSDDPLNAELVALLAKENITPVALFASVDQLGGKVLADGSFRKQVVALLIDLTHPQTSSLATHGFERPALSRARSIDTSVMISSGIAKLREVFDAIDVFSSVGIGFETVELFGPLARAHGDQLEAWANRICNDNSFETIFERIKYALSECGSSDADNLRYKTNPHFRMKGAPEILIYLNDPSA